MEYDLQLLFKIGPRSTGINTSLLPKSTALCFLRHQAHFGIAHTWAVAMGTTVLTTHTLRLRDSVANVGVSNQFKQHIHEIMLTSWNGNDAQS